MPHILITTDLKAAKMEEKKKSSRFAKSERRPLLGQDTNLKKSIHKRRRNDEQFCQAKGG